MTARISMFALKTQFQKDTREQLGEVLVIPKTAFKEEWREDLKKQGHECVDSVEHGQDVVFVKVNIDMDLLKKSNMIIQKRGDELRTQVSPGVTGTQRLSEKIWKAYQWTDEEIKVLTEIWKQDPHLSVSAVAAAFLKVYPKRTEASIMNKVHDLQKIGRLEPRFKRRTKLKESKKQKETLEVPIGKQPKLETVTPETVRRLERTLLIFQSFPNPFTATLRSVKPKCIVCGKEANQIIRNKLPGATISVLVCDVDAYTTYNAIKWKLVTDGTWNPEAFTLETLPAGALLDEILDVKEEKKNE